MPVTRSAAKALNLKVAQDFASPEPKRLKRKSPACSRQGMESSVEKDGKKTVAMESKRIKSEHTKVVALNEDEKKMDGAPVAELAEVTVSAFEDLKPIEDDSNEKDAQRCALKLLAKKVNDDTGSFDADWVIKFDAISSIRRLSKFQPRALVDCIGDLLPVVCGLSAHLRSALSRNAILCIGEVSMCVPAGIDGVESQKKIRSTIEANLGVILSALLYKASSDKKFLAGTAKESLKSIIVGLSGGLLLRELLQFSDPSTSKNPVMVGVAAHFADKCLERLGIGKDAGKGFHLECPNRNCEDFCKDVIIGLNKFSAGKSVEAKTCAKKSFQKMRICLGGSFAESVKLLLGPHDAQRVLKDSQPKSGRVGGKSSLRDRLAADRAKRKNFGKAPVCVSEESMGGVGIMQFASKTGTGIDGSHAKVTIGDQEKSSANGTKAD